MGRYIALRPLPVGDGVVRAEGEEVPEALDWAPTALDQWVLAGALRYDPDEAEEYHGPQPLQPYVIDKTKAIEEPSIEEETPEAEVESSPIPEKVADVLEWVGEDPERALEALVAEDDRPKPRKSLVLALNEVIETAS